MKVAGNRCVYHDERGQRGFGKTLDAYWYGGVSLAIDERKTDF